MMISFPADIVATVDPEPALTPYDVACNEAAERVSDGYCPLCAAVVAGLATTCGDVDCLTYMTELPGDRRWLLDELRRMQIGNQARQPAAADGDVVWLTGWWVWLAVLGLGMMGAGVFAAVVLAGRWLGWLAIPVQG